MSKITISKRLKELCEEKNFTISKLSEKSGVEIELLEKIIDGRTPDPGIVAFLQICTALDISPDDFLDSNLC